MARKRESQRITLIGGVLLAALTLVSGFAVYAVMQRQLEAVLVNSLQSSLHSDRRLFETEIRGSVVNALTVSTRPFVIQNLARLREAPEDASAAHSLQRLVRRLVKSQQQTAEANARLRDLEERWRFALDSAGAGVWDLDLSAGKILLSVRCKHMLGYEEHEIGTSAEEWQALVHRDDAPALIAACQRLVDGEVQSFTHEHRKRCKDGSWKWVQARGMVAARDENGAPTRLIGTYIDISERKRAEEIIQQQANFDPLTKLPNRRLFLDRLDQQIAKCQRTGAALALLLIDLDEFKEVNDTLGHDVGDVLLQEAARRISGCIRDTDTVARLGGDEFTVILSDLTGKAHVEEIAQKLISRVAEPYYLREGVAHISASIGITLYPGDAEDMGELMKHADQAMYSAKRLGRNRFCYFTHALQEAAQKRLRLSRELRQAVNQGQFEAHFQPIVELASGRIQKAEALLRWQHPERGLVGPEEFIPLAEDTGLIEGVGDWVFREAVRRARVWRDRFGTDIQVSVNMSPVQFRSEGAERVESWLYHLEEMGVRGEQIVIEITENLLLHAHDGVTRQLFRFRDAGVQIAIDDFGTGYCTLSYLKQFPIDYLKIDRSFVRNLENDPNDVALSKAIIVMAHELGLKVIAEGVESEEQRRLLSEAGCDFAQGYLFARALPVEDFENLLSEGGRMSAPG
ncbi:putative bifunctional diguanylate cyclase/phosphodiesterase [Thioalkalivibrio sulfidiphilus]|uniref:putative bifunctional diguanylate cyclase/phosphodiesterase n=1 Tax=Thioalkalivibrio sulfidiphilus TaxID=1033854 RepID=UPI003BAEC821